MVSKIKCNCFLCGEEFMCDGEYCFSSDPKNHLCKECKNKKDVKIIDEDMKVWRKTKKFL